MRFFRTISTIVVVVVVFLVLWNISKTIVSTHALPTLGEYMASSTLVENRTSNSGQTSTWMSSSTLVSLLLSGNQASSTSSSTETFMSPTTLPASTVKKSSTPIFSVRSTLAQGYLGAPKGTIRLLIAKTPTARERGLSGYPSIAQDQGMLFIFPREEGVGFWMKDMNFPLDLVWMNAGRKIVGITENVSPYSYPKTFASPGSVQFVLELNAGAAQKFGLKKGNLLQF